MYHPTLEEFYEKAKEGNLIPVYREILADLETPVSAFLKIDQGKYSYLLESVEGGEKWARYSFLGCQPSVIVRGSKDSIEIIKGSRVEKIPLGRDPLETLKGVMERYKPVGVEGLPRFFGGAVGYVGYDVVRFFESIQQRKKAGLGLPDFFFFITDTLLIFDSVNQKIKVVSHAHVEKGMHPRAAYGAATMRITEIISRLKSPRRGSRKGTRGGGQIRFASNLTKPEFEKMVLKTKEYIKTGDIFQAVLSQRFSTPVSVHPFNIYRALRVTNPSPYRYYLHCGDFHIVGSSPEVLVRCEEGRLELRPIAGTRPRGKTEQEDKALREELVADVKERAEHIMLVDLGRNDLGRVSRSKSVSVKELMMVEKYSHVMHLVSNIAGELSQGKDAYDVLRACFPAGTVSGAPKIRAMQIIEELEPTRRGLYAGAVGYVSFTGNLDTCINIRTIVVKGRTAYIQAGAGIVADSDPGREYDETVNKGKALAVALEMAERGLD